jgi:hypothetical protein
MTLREFLHALVDTLNSLSAAAGDAVRSARNFLLDLPVDYYAVAVLGLFALYGGLLLLLAAGVVVADFTSGLLGRPSPFKGQPTRFHSAGKSVRRKVRRRGEAHP